MHSIKTIFTLLLIAIFFVFTESCHRKNTPNNSVELDANCLLQHEAGPCKGAFTRYYYDKKEKKCKSFIYGGCQGVVPFETLEECEGKCDCE